MVITSPVKLDLNNLPYGGVSAPAVGKSPNQKQKSMSLEEAKGLLNLVTVGKEVLNVSSLNQEPSRLTYIAQAIKDATKNEEAWFDHGRIHTSKETFIKIVASSEKKVNNATAMNSGPFHYKMPEITKISV